MKIAIIGYGKMGKTIEQLALARGHELIMRIGSDNLHEMTKSSLEKADVAIEFSKPEHAFGNIERCLFAGIPVVSGTTGWLERIDEIKDICGSKAGAFFYASNFSIGVNIFFEINRQLAKMMNEFPEYDITMEEIHHIQKLDAPSGTAITLADEIINRLERKSHWVNTTSLKNEALSIVSKRKTSVPGTHIINYSSTIDSIEIKHTAHSREGFAKGALAAAEWIIGKKGVFGMKDLLGF